MTKLKGKSKSKARKKSQSISNRKYAAYKKNILSLIRTYDDEILKTSCSVIKPDENYKDIIFLMKKVLRHTANGVGLAAPQVGYSKRILIFRDNPDSRSVQVMINPEIVSHGENKRYGKEECLSFPGVQGIIERYTEIEVKYYDEDWKEHIVKCGDKDFNAIIIQHEMSHLNGNCDLYSWWKNPEEQQNKLEKEIEYRNFPEAKQKEGEGYEVVESDDLKEEKSI